MAALLRLAAPPMERGGKQNEVERDAAWDCIALFSLCLSFESFPVKSIFRIKCGIL
jgi:hypothetical protein